MELLETLQSIDTEWLLFINGIAGDISWLDQFMIGLSSKLMSAPLYLLIFYSVWKKFGVKQALWILLAAVAMIILTDQGSVQFFKEFFQRSRPCHNDILMGQIALITGKCGGQYGFISSHASNVFGLAAFVSVLFSSNRLWLLIYVWAILVALSRVYLGVHYPSDILFGALFGLSVGWAMGLITNRFIKIK